MWSWRAWRSCSSPTQTSGSRRSILQASLPPWRRRPSTASRLGSIARLDEELCERPVVGVAILLFAKAVAFVAGLKVPDLAALGAHAIDDLLGFAQGYPRIILAVHDEQGARNALRIRQR